jgi:hypothetical protein
MTIDLSTITFTNQADIVPESGEDDIVNTGIANTLAGNDTITGSGIPSDDYSPNSGYGIYNTGTLNTAEGKDIITGTGDEVGIYNTGTFNTGEGKDIITGGDYEGIYNTGIYNTGTFNTAEGDDIITGKGGGTEAPLATPARSIRAGVTT